MHGFYNKTYGYSKSFRFLKNHKISLVCKIDITLLKVVIQEMLFLFYFLIIIIKIIISIQIFPQLPFVCFLDCSKVCRNILVSFDNPIANAKKYYETYRHFF